MTARPAASTATDDRQVEYVTLTAGGHRYAVETGAVRQVVELTDPVRVPDAPEAVEGITNVRGEVTVVLDAAAVLGPVPSTSPGLPDQVVVFDRGRERQSAGIRLSSIDGVETYPLSAAVSASRSDVETPVGTDLLRAVVETDGEPVFVLDPDAVSRAGASVAPSD